jgi:hypothetical protein
MTKQKLRGSKGLKKYDRQLEIWSPFIASLVPRLGRQNYLHRVAG